MPRLMGGKALTCLEVHSVFRAGRLFPKQGPLCCSVRAFETKPEALLIILEGNLQEAISMQTGEQDLRPGVGRLAPSCP